jgi:hypothetical protein
MKEWTGIEIERARQGLEQASATILGRMIFEYSRLDMALGLMLVWANHGSQLESLTQRVSGSVFHKKLGLLADLASKNYQDDSGALAAHNEWLTEAHEVREERNALVHGRWCVDPTGNQVVNVLGLPTGEQVERRYTVAQLKALLLRIRQLQQSLAVLRAQWPV